MREERGAGTGRQSRTSWRRSYPWSLGRCEESDPASMASRCPYKGLAEYYSAAVNGKTYDDIVWSYRAATLESEKISCRSTTRKSTRSSSTAKSCQSRKRAGGDGTLVVHSRTLAPMAVMFRIAS